MLNISSANPSPLPYARTVLSPMAGGLVPPRIGGHDFSIRNPEIFKSERYRQRYRPGTPRLVYVARCAGLKSMSDKLAVPLNKVSTCGSDRLNKRLGDLAREGYGAFYLSHGAPVREDGFQNWTTYRPPAGLHIASGSPVTIAGAALRIVIPATMTRRTFDRHFDELVQRGCVGFWLRTAPDARSPSKILLPPHYADRFTCRQRGTHHKLERAKEFVAFRGAEDFARLVAIIEHVVLTYLGL